MRFYKTNSVDDHGYEVSMEEVVGGFRTSEQATSWRENGGRLFRFVSWYLTEHVGGWDFADEDGPILDDIVEAVLRAERGEV